MYSSTVVGCVVLELAEDNLVNGNCHPRILIFTSAFDSGTSSLLNNKSGRGGWH